MSKKSNFKYLGTEGACDFPLRTRMADHLSPTHHADRNEAADDGGCLLLEEPSPTTSGHFFLFLELTRAVQETACLPEWSKGKDNFCISHTPGFKMCNSEI
jgi:hypothetical protein